MTEILTLLQNASPFIVLAFLGVLYFQSRNKEADTARYRAELESNTAKYRADESLRQYEINKQQAVLWGQMVVAMDGIVATQKQTRGAVGKSEETVKQAVSSSEGRVIAQVVASKDDVIAVLKLLGKVNNDVFQPVASEPPDLVAMQTILEDTIQAIEAAKKRMATGVASQVIVTDVSPTAIESIVQAVTPKADNEEAA